MAPTKKNWTAIIIALILTAVERKTMNMIYVLQNTGSAMINTQEFARAVRGVCNEEKEKKGEPDEL